MVDNGIHRHSRRFGRGRSPQHLYLPVYVDQQQNIHVQQYHSMTNVGDILNTARVVALHNVFHYMPFDQDAVNMNSGYSVFSNPQMFLHNEQATETLLNPEAPEFYPMSSSGDIVEFSQFDGNMPLHENFDPQGFQSDPSWNVSQIHNIANQEMLFLYNQDLGAQSEAFDEETYRNQMSENHSKDTELQDNDSECNEQLLVDVADRNLTEEGQNISLSSHFYGDVSPFSIDNWHFQQQVMYIVPYEIPSETEGQYTPVPYLSCSYVQVPYDHYSHNQQPMWYYILPQQSPTQYNSASYNCNHPAMQDQMYLQPIFCVHPPHMTYYTVYACSTCGNQFTVQYVYFHQYFMWTALPQNTWQCYSLVHGDKNSAIQEEMQYFPCQLLVFYMPVLHLCYYCANDMYSYLQNQTSLVRNDVPPSRAQQNPLAFSTSHTQTMSQYIHISHIQNHSNNHVLVEQNLHYEECLVWNAVYAQAEIHSANQILIQQFGQQEVYMRNVIPAQITCYWSFAWSYFINQIQGHTFQHEYPFLCSALQPQSTRFNILTCGCHVNHASYQHFHSSDPSMGNSVALQALRQYIFLACACGYYHQVFIQNEHQ